MPHGLKPRSYTVVEEVHICVEARSATATYAVVKNATGLARTETLTLVGKTFTVTQSKWRKEAAGASSIPCGNAVNFGVS